jgi:putative ABC transport system substrate-binding protein
MTAALLIVDIQNDYFPGGAMEVIGANAAAIEAAKLLAAFRQKARPIIVEGEGFGLLPYGVSLRQQYRRAAGIAARLLEGAKASDLPVEQPTRYELVINIRVAEEYAITLPRELVMRADRVIR